MKPPVAPSWGTGSALLLVGLGVALAGSGSGADGLEPPAGRLLLAPSQRSSWRRAFLGLAAGLFFQSGLGLPDLQAALAEGKFPGQFVSALVFPVEPVFFLVFRSASARNRPPFSIPLSGTGGRSRGLVLGALLSACRRGPHVQFDQSRLLAETQDWVKRPPAPRDGVCGKRRWSRGRGGFGKNAVGILVGGPPSLRERLALGIAVDEEFVSRAGYPGRPRSSSFRFPHDGRQIRESTTSETKKPRCSGGT